MILVLLFILAVLGGYGLRTGADPDGEFHHGRRNWRLAFMIGGGLLLAVAVPLLAARA